MSLSIGVIIPVYNQPGALIHALESLATQRVLPQEVIIVDDGSRVPIHIDDHISKKLNISLIRQNNAGAPAARNTGFEASASDATKYRDNNVVCDRHPLE